MEVQKQLTAAAKSTALVVWCGVVEGGYFTHFEGCS